jgi:hypothetical protein
MGSAEDGDTAAEHLDAAGSVHQAQTWPKVMTDYHGALVRLATMRAAGKQYLLFGYVELFPRISRFLSISRPEKSHGRFPTSAGM